MDREMENKLLNAGKENETAKGTDVESLKEKYCLLYTSPSPRDA